LKRSLALAGLVFAAVALADQKELISGPGSRLTNAKCSICHDNEHIFRSKLTREEWDDNVKNMLSRGMPPLTAEETRIIVEYLSTYYGPNPPPAPSPDTLATGSGDPMAQMLDKYACSSCHAVDKKIVGPAFREVAAKYAGDAGAPARLAEKIRYGGQGAWGPVPMPGNPAISAADQKTLAGWVLQQK